MNVPTHVDWHSEPLCLDGKCAFKNFSGKDLTEAFDLFVDNALYYQEDIMFMPTLCFRYYVRAYINYLLSPKSEGDSDGANCFFGLVEIRAEDVSTSDQSLRQDIAEVLLRLSDQQQWFDAEINIYGSFPKRAQTCLDLIGFEHPK